MHRFRFAALAAGAVIGSASMAYGADLPPKAPVYKAAPVTPAFSWTGFYLGGELGWMRASPEFTPGAVILGAPFIASSLPISDRPKLSP